MSRYDNISRVKYNKVMRIGTADLPKFEEKNSNFWEI